MPQIFEQNGIRLENCDCIPKLRTMPSKSVDLVITDIPYGAVNRESNGLRNLDKKNADIVRFDLTEMCRELVRIAKGSIYLLRLRTNIDTFPYYGWGGHEHTAMCMGKDKPLANEWRAYMAIGY